MIKKRLIAKIIIKENLVIQSINFSKYLPVGSLESSFEYFNNWQADEIFLIDISNQIDLKNNCKLISNISKTNNLPLCYGGGIKKKGDIDILLRSGVDKVCLNKSAFTNKKLLSEISNTYGMQCLIVSLDIKKIDNKYFIFNRNSKNYLPLIKNEIIKFEDCGVGEFFIQSIDNDGTKQGFDIDLMELILKLTNKPTIFSSGYGKPQHINNIIKSNISAIAIGNSLHFEEMSILKIKNYINKFNKKKIFRIEKDYIF